MLVFEANPKFVKNIPETFEDLLKPEYKKMISISDPTFADQAHMSAWAAGIERTGGEIEGAAEASLEFWAEMNKAGNLNSFDTEPTRFEIGLTPLNITWDYLALADRDTLEGVSDVLLTIPKTVALGGPYAGAINAFSPRPYAARLWVEYYISDEGQLNFLEGYAHPARYQDPVQRNIIPQELAAKLPPAKYYEKVIFPALDEIVAAKKTISENWKSQVLGE